MQFQKTGITKTKYTSMKFNLEAADGSAAIQAFSRRTAQSQASPHGICGGHSAPPPLHRLTAPLLQARIIPISLTTHNISN